MFSDRTAGKVNGNERALHGAPGTLRLERGGGLLPRFESALTATGTRQIVQGPRQMEPGTVTLLAASSRGPSGNRRGSGERGPLGAAVAALGRVCISLPIALAATIYQLPARMIISAIKEAGGDVQSPWGSTVTKLGNAESMPEKTAANALGWLALVPALLWTAVTNIQTLGSNLVRRPGKTIGGFFYGLGKGFVGFLHDKAVEVGSTVTGNGPSYYNLAAQYYTSGH